jgi:hypothetical protein
MKTQIASVLILTIFSCSSLSTKEPSSSAEEIKPTHTDTVSNEYRKTLADDPKNIWEIIDTKANWFKENKQGYDNLALMPADFSEFYDRFISDSLYQVQHIYFNSLIGVIGDCDTTIHLNKYNWKFETWNFTEHFNNQHEEDNIEDWDNRIYFNNQTFFYEFNLNEVGIIYQTGFEKIKGSWQLTLMYVNNC